MDDSSDVDNSLIDLHHGLDSSFDEHPSGLCKQELASQYASASMDAPNGVGVTEDQMSMLQDMVLEMKEGFKNALKELAKIQDKEEGETYHSRKLQQQQQRQLDDLTETIHEIKDQLSSLTKSVKQIKDEQITIKGHLEDVRSNGGSSQESKPRNERDRLGLVNDFTNPEEWNTKLPELPPEFDDHNNSSRLTFETDDNEVTVTACRSLILTQALSDKCLKMNISQSSDEEDEEHENRRLSYYTPKTAGVISGRAENRRHSMPNSAASQGRAKDVGIAAQRQKAVKELADLEREYCAQLWSLLHTYLTPLQTAGFLNARELGTLFPPYLDQLYAEHCHVCTGLQDRLAHWTYMGTVADLLARITDSHNSESLLSLYKEYVDDLLSAVTCLRRVQAQSSKFRSFLKAVKHSSYRSEDLMSLLLAPVQHIPKYLIQLQQVLRHTPTTHADYPLLQSSLCRLQSFVDQMNEELSGTAEVLNQDRHVWSSGNTGQIFSTRDSGVHSNSTEDDNVMPSKSFSKPKRSHVSSEWLEDPGYGVYHRKFDDIIRQRHVRPSISRLSALSQPDLTVYNSLNSPSSDPHIFTHMPRSQSSLPIGVVESGDEVTRGRQYRKFKIKRRNQSPVDYTTATKGHLHRSLSPQVRPSSAIDFLSHSHHQQYQHPNNYRELPVQLRKLHYPERHPRPHSVLGPHVADLNHKPTIISRKHTRRSQPLIPASTNFWAETTTASTLPFRVGHLRVPSSARDLLPKRPSHYTTSDVLDGDDEQDEDDTRASDTHSLGTNGSHPYSSGQGSNNSHDIELELYQGHIGAFNSQTLKQGHNLSHSSEFSSAEVAASLARKLYDAQQGSDINREGLLLKQVSSEVFETKASPITEQSSVLSQIVSNHVNGSQTVRERYLIPSNGGGSHMFGDPTKPKLVESEEEDSQNSTAFTNKSLYSNEESVTSFSQERDESLSSRSNSRIVSRFAKRVGGVDGCSEDGNDEIEQLSERNRQFLLSVSTRSPSNDRQELDTSYSVSSKRDILSGNWTSNLNKRNQTQLNSGSCDSSSHVRPEPKADLFSQCSNNGSSDVNESSNLNGSLGVPATQSNPLSNMHQQPLSHLVGHNGCERVSSEIILTQKNRPVRSRTLSNVQSSLQNLQHDTSSLVKMNFSSLDSHQSHDKQSPLPSFPTSNSSETAPTRQATTDTSQINGVAGQVNNNNDLLSYPDSHELPPLEVDDPVPDGGGRKADFRKKLKDGGKFNSSDGLPKAIDDPVNARKKMHFKSSIKNLFSKKKGQVILADVEREVVKQMTTAAVEGTELLKSKAYLRKQKTCNLRDCHAPHKTEVKGQTFESKTWKGQNGSNLILAKVAKKFYSDSKQQKSVNGENDRDLSEYEQYQQQRHVLHSLKAHNKRHGIVVDRNDTPFNLKLDMGNDFASAARQDIGSKSHFNDNYHSQSKNGVILYQLQQRPQIDSTCETFGANIWNKSAIICKKKMTPKHYQSQTVQKEQIVLRNSIVNEVDPLKSTYDVCQNKAIHKNSKDIIENGNIYKAKFKTEKSHGDFPAKRSTFSSHDLCQHCQKCEVRQRDKVTPGCKETNGLSLKNCDSECETKLTVCYPGDKSQVSISDSTCHISSNAQFNNLNEGNRPLISEKVMPFPLAVKPFSLSFTECLKPPKLMCDNDKISEMNSSDALTEWQPEQFVDRCKHCNISPIQDQTTTSKYQHHHSSMAIHNMPDVTKISEGAVCSDKIDRHHYLKDVSSEKSCVESVIDHVSPADTCHGNNKMLSQSGAEFYNSIERTSSSVLSHLVSDNYDGKMPVLVSPSNMSLSSQKLVATSSSAQYFSALPQVMSSESRSHFQKEQRASNQIPRSRSTTLPKTFPDKECSESFVMEETHNGIVVKRFSLEGKEFCEHRYYGDETGQRRNLKRSENPKSLKALSASSVIAGNFKQLPRETHFSYDKNHKTCEQPALYLTLSSASDDLPEKRQANNCTVGSRFSDSILTGPKLLLQSPTDPNKKQGKVILTAGNSHLAYNRPFYSGLLATSHGKSPDNDTVVPHHNDCNHTGTNGLPETSSALRAPLFPAHQEPKEDETSLKHIQANNVSDTDGNASVVTESASRLHTSPCFSNASLTDESNSYKPKNPIPITNMLLSGATECQSSSSEIHPHVALEDPNKQHHPSSEHAISSSSQNLPTYMPTSYSHESHRQMTSNSGLRAKDDIQCSGSYSCRQSGNGSLYKERHGFPRTNSPSDFFSIRPYVDYTASKASSDSGILVHSEYVRSSTPKGMKSSKGSSSEKLDTGRKHPGYRKARSGSEKNSKCCKSPNKCTENVSNSDDVENCQSSYSRRTRHSDGAKFSAQDDKCYQVQYPRYSADSSSLISNAFLQKMAHLSKHTIRSESHSHVDESHLSSSTRHASSSGSELTVLPSTHSSRSFRITSSAAKNLPPPAHSAGSCVSNDETPQLNYENPKSRSSSAKAEMTSIQASPDLLLSNDGMKEEATTKEKSPLSRKAQSFFSKLTHSPISLFYRDAKSLNPPK